MKSACLSIALSIVAWDFSHAAVLYAIGDDGPTGVTSTWASLDPYSALMWLDGFDTGYPDRGAHYLPLKWPTGADIGYFDGVVFGPESDQLSPWANSMTREEMLGEVRRYSDELIRRGLELNNASDTSASIPEPGVWVLSLAGSLLFWRRNKPV